MDYLSKKLLKSMGYKDLKLSRDRHTGLYWLATRDEKRHIFFIAEKRDQVDVGYLEGAKEKQRKRNYPTCTVMSEVKFSEAAEQWAQEHEVQLWGPKELKAMGKQYGENVDFLMDEDDFVYSLEEVKLKEAREMEYRVLQMEGLQGWDERDLLIELLVETRVMNKQLEWLRENGR